jgi:hypothetical protein
MTRQPETYEVLSQMKSQREALMIERRRAKAKRRTMRRSVLILCWIGLAWLAQIAIQMHTGINIFDFEGIGPNGWRYEQ